MAAGPAFATRDARLVGVLRMGPSEISLAINVLNTKEGIGSNYILGVSKFPRSIRKLHHVIVQTVIIPATEWIAPWYSAGKLQPWLLPSK
jgi:hypothetical protein